jgi:hypothetical protein
MFHWWCIDKLQTLHVQNKSLQMVSLVVVVHKRLLYKGHKLMGSSSSPILHLHANFVNEFKLGKY